MQRAIITKDCEMFQILNETIEMDSQTDDEDVQHNRQLMDKQTQKQDIQPLNNNNDCDSFEVSSSDDEQIQMQSQKQQQQNLIDNNNNHKTKQKQQNGNSQVVFQTIELRKYQIEIFMDILESNKIIQLDTGLGKTLIAILLIFYKANKYANKKIIFIANTIQLADQQYQQICKQYRNIKMNRKQIYEQIQDYLSKKTGYNYDEKLKKLKEVFYRDEIADTIINCINGRQQFFSQKYVDYFRTSQIIVMTPVILLNILRRGQSQISDIGIIVFDECHHCTQNHSYNNIMTEIYFLEKNKQIRQYVHNIYKMSNSFSHIKVNKLYEDIYMDKKLSFNELPQIIGLTASPVTSKIVKNYNKNYVEQYRNVIKQLCLNLDCTFANFDRKTVDGYYNEPQLNYLQYEQIQNYDNISDFSKNSRKVDQNQKQMFIDMIKTQYPQIYMINDAFWKIKNEFMRENEKIYQAVLNYIEVVEDCLLYEFIYFEMEIGKRSLIFIIDDLLKYIDKFKTKIERQKTLILSELNKKHNLMKQKDQQVDDFNFYLEQYLLIIDENVYNFNMKIVQDINNFLINCKKNIEYQIQGQEKFSNKLNRLFEEILKLQKQNEQQHKIDIVLIFVERRIIAWHICRLLNNTIKQKENQKVAEFLVGSSNLKSKKTKREYIREFKEQNSFNQKLQQYLENNDGFEYKEDLDIGNIDHKDFQKYVQKYYSQKYQKTNLTQQIYQQKQTESIKVQEELLEIQNEELEKIDVNKIKKMNLEMEELNRSVRLEQMAEINQTIYMSDDESDVVYQYNQEQKIGVVEYQYTNEECYNNDSNNGQIPNDSLQIDNNQIQQSKQIEMENNEQVEMQQGKSQILNQIQEQVSQMNLQEVRLFKFKQNDPQLVAPDNRQRYNNVAQMNCINANQILTNLRKSQSSFKILVSTDVTEEGLDLPDCNIVFTYNDIDSLTQFIQMKGRARKKDSLFNIMTNQPEKNKEKVQEYIGDHKVVIRILEQFQNNHYLQKDLCMNLQEQIEELKQLRMTNFKTNNRKKDFEYQKFRLSRCILNTNWSVQCLMEYCNHLNKSKKLNKLDEKNKLIFNTFYRNNLGYCCIIKMPISCTIQFGDICIENTKDYVIKKAAFDMIKQLYVDNQLNSNLKYKSSDQPELLTIQYNCQNFKQFFQNNEQYIYFSDDLEKMVFFKVMNVYYQQNYQMVKVGPNQVRQEVRNYYFNYTNQFLYSNVQIDSEYTNTINLYVYQIKLSQLHKSQRMMEDLLVGSDNQVGILSVSRLKMIEGKVFVDNLSNISKQQHNQLEVEFVLQEEQFNIKMKDITELICASHFLFCSVKDLDIAFYSLFDESPVNEKGLFSNFYTRKENYKKDIPKKIEDWIQKPYLIFSLLKKQDNQYVVDYQKILEIIDYIYFMSIVYNKFNQLDERITEKQRKDLCAEFARKNYTNYTINNPSTLQYYDLIQKEPEPNNQIIIQNIANFNKNYNASVQSYKTSIEKITRQQILDNYQEKMQLIKYIIDEQKINDDYLVRLGSIKKLNDYYFAQVDYSQVYQTHMNKLIKKAKYVDYQSDNFFYIYNFSQEFVVFPIKMDIFLVLKQLFNGEILSKQLRDYLKVFEFQKYLNELEQRTNKNEFYDMQKYQEVDINAKQHKLYVQKQLYEPYCINFYKNTFLYLFKSDPDFQPYISENHPFLMKTFQIDHKYSNLASRLVQEQMIEYYESKEYLGHFRNERKNKDRQNIVKYVDIDKLKQSLQTVDYDYQHNYEQLEFLGDSILKILTSIEVYIKNDLQDQNILNFERKKLITNESLKNKCLIYKVFTFILSQTQPFIAPGLINTHNEYDQVDDQGQQTIEDMQKNIYQEFDSMYQQSEHSQNNDHSQVPTNFQQLNNKQLADVIESLIGVFYLIDKDLNDCQKLLFMFKIVQHYSLDVENQYEKQTELEMQQKINNLDKSESIHEIYNQPDILSERIHLIEKRLKYTFKNKNLIVQSFIAPNIQELQYTFEYSKKTKIQENCQLHYERLEFLGDAVLDFMVVELLWKVLIEDNKYKMKIDQGHLSQLKSSIVRNISLAQLLWSMNLEVYILDRDNKPELFHKMILDKYKDKLVNVEPDLFYQLVYSIMNDNQLEFYNYKYEFEQFVKLSADVMEAIVGAIYIDTNLDLQTLKQVLLGDHCMNWLVNKRLQYYHTAFKSKK